MRKLSLNLVISAIAVILIFLLLELFASFFNPILKISHNDISFGIGGREVLEYPSGYIKDRELFWRLEPSFAKYNSKGFRDREFPFQKETNTFRIICMGDSVTFGWPVQIDNTYPKVLERLLNSQFPKKRFEVLNAGVPGYTSYQGKIQLEKEIIKLNPNLIIVYYGVNDRGGAYKRDKEQWKLPKWIIKIENMLGKFHFYKLFLKIILYFKYPPGKTRYLTNRVPPDDYKINLADINKIVEENKAKALFIAKPAFFDPGKKLVFTDKTYVPQENLLQFDIYNVFKIKEKEAGELFVNDIQPANFHLTEKGQKILAEELYKFLTNNGRLKDMVTMKDL